MEVPFLVSIVWLFQGLYVVLWIFWLQMPTLITGQAPNASLYVIDIAEEDYDPIAPTFNPLFLSRRRTTTPDSMNITGILPNILLDANRQASRSPSNNFTTVLSNGTSWFPVLLPSSVSHSIFGSSFFSSFASNSDAQNEKSSVSGGVSSLRDQHSVFGTGVTDRLDSSSASSLILQSSTGPFFISVTPVPFAQWNSSLSVPKMTVAVPPIFILPNRFPVFVPITTMTVLRSISTQPSLKSVVPILQSVTVKIIPRPSTAVSIPTRSPSVETGTRNMTLLPTKTLLQMVVAVPSAALNTTSLDYGRQLTFGLNRVLQESEVRLRSENTSTPDSTGSTKGPVSPTSQHYTSVIAQVSPTRDNLNATILFTVVEDNVVVPSATVLSMLDSLSTEEITALLGAQVLQRPTVAMLDSTTEASLITASAPSASLYGAIIGVSTVAAVLLAILSIWLMLCIWVRCTGRSSKTSPTPSAANSAIPIKTPRRTERVDQAIQTVVLPRKSLVPVDERVMNNGSTAGNRERIIERLSQTAVVRRSFLGEERIPDRAAPGRRPTHQIPPTKAQEEYSRREEPTNGEQYSPVRAEPRKTHDTLRELETPHTGPAANKNSHRIKLVSVVKTNRIKPKITPRKNNPRKYEVPYQIENENYGSSYDTRDTWTKSNSRRPSSKDPEISRRGPARSFGRDAGRAGRNLDLAELNGGWDRQRTVQEIRREVRLWRTAQNNGSVE